MISSKAIPAAIKTYAAITKSEEITENFLPFPSVLPFELSIKTPLVYSTVYFYQVFCIALFGVYISTFDTISTGLIIHISTQFEIVSDSISLVPRSACPKNDLRKCIEHHCLIFDTIKKTENALSMMFLFQFLGSLMTICVGLYQTSIVEKNSPTFVFMFCFTSAIMFQLYIICQNGQEMSNASEKVALAVYNSDWTILNSRMKKDLGFILFRSQQTCFLTAGKFSKLSLQTFMALVKGSVSYFMVLKKLNDN